MVKRNWLKRLNDIDAANANYCQMITSSHELEEFFAHEPFLVEIFTNYKSKNLDPLTLFWCFLISFMHWWGFHRFQRFVSVSDACVVGLTIQNCSIRTKWIISASNCMEYFVVIQVYIFIQTDAKTSMLSILVSNKSAYIRTIRTAFDFVERYFRELFIDKNNKFASSCIESISSTKLLNELETSSVIIILLFSFLRILSNLLEIHFFRRRSSIDRFLIFWTELI